MHLVCVCACCLSGIPLIRELQVHLYWGGVGMCCTMVWADMMFVPGIFIGVAGLAGIVSAYPVYNYIMKKQREKLAPEILKLTGELMRGGEG